MTDSKQWLKWMAIGCLGVVLLVAIGPYLSKQAAKQRVVRQENALLKKWATQNFTPIEHTDAFGERLRVAVESRVDRNLLTEQQYESLIDSIRSLLFAYSDGSFESFAKFRFPIEDEKALKFRINSGDYFIGAIANDSFLSNIMVLSSAKTASDFSNTNSPLNIVHTFWDVRLRKLTNRRTGLPAFCCDCLKGANLKDISINLFDEKKLPPPIYLSCTMSNSFGFFRMNPRFEILPLPDDILKSDRHVQSAQVRLLVATSSIVKALPINVHWYWSPKIQQWVPLEFVIGYGTGSDLQFFF